MSRPRVKIEKKNPDLIIESMGWLLLIGLWHHTLSAYITAPELIPIHFNGSGEADGYGNKKHLLILSSLASLLYIGLFYLNRFPHIFNYTVTITSENAGKQYSLANRLIRCMNLTILGFICLVQYSICDTAASGKLIGGPWSLIAFVVSLPSMLFIYIYKAGQKS